MQIDPLSIDQLIVELTAAKDRQGQTEVPPLNPPPPGGTYPSMSPAGKPDWEPRVGRLEVAFCAAFLVLAGMIGGLYLYFNSRFDAVNEKIADVQVQVAQTNGKIDLLLERTAPKK